jgi:hypothetical protein
MTAYDRRAGTDYVFAVRITNHSYALLVLQEFRAHLPWRGRVQFFEDPRRYTPEKKVYRLASGHEFPYDEVLNHRIHLQGLLEPRQSLEGLLLAHTISHRIPFEILHGTIAPAELCAVDQFGREHHSEIEITIDRSATLPSWVFAPSRRPCSSPFAGRNDEHAVVSRPAPCC